MAEEFEFFTAKGKRVQEAWDGHFGGLRRTFCVDERSGLAGRQEESKSDVYVGTWLLGALCV